MAALQSALEDTLEPDEVPITAAERLTLGQVTTNSFFLSLQTVLLSPGQ